MERHERYRRSTTHWRSTASIKKIGDLISDNVASESKLSKQETVEINRDRRLIVLEGGRILLDQPRKIC